MKSYDKLIQENSLLKKEIASKNEKISKIIAKYEKIIRKNQKSSLYSAINEIVKINKNYTIKDISTLFNVSTTTVYRAIKQSKEVNL